jgi:hypothetical protein
MLLETCKQIFRASGGGSACVADAVAQIRSELPEQLTLTTAA